MAVPVAISERFCKLPIDAYRLFAVVNTGLKWSKHDHLNVCIYFALGPLHKSFKLCSTPAPRSGFSLKL